MRAFHYADIPILLRPSSRYPLHKFPLMVSEVVERGILLASSVVRGEQIPAEVLRLAHTADYVELVRAGPFTDAQERMLGFCWSPELYIRGATIVGCCVSAAEDALSQGIGIVLGGGAHHAGTMTGRGYCIFNDIACTALHLLATRQVSKIAVFDCDVHQGDGTAEILSGYEQIFTCSIHGEKNYPFRKVSSSLDLNLGDCCGDATYLEAVDTGLRSSLFDFEPELLFYIAGADPFERDRLGRLKISADGLRTRDRMVFEAAYQLEIPLVIAFGGGYCEPISETVDRNMETLEQAVAVYT